MPEDREELDWKQEWEKEARALRYWKPAESSETGKISYGLPRQVLLSLLLVGVLGGALWLLVFPIHRQAGVEFLLAGWSRWTASESVSRVYDLPPPPLKTVEARPVDLSPIIILPSEERVIRGAESQWEKEAEPVSPVLLKTDAFRAAFTMLTLNSPAADRLVKGEMPGFKYQDWKPVNDASPVLWVELSALADDDGREVSFTWSVNTEEGTVRALSQAARDLESRARE